MFFHDVKTTLTFRSHNNLKDSVEIVRRRCANIRSKRFAKHLGHTYFCARLVRNFEALRSRGSEAAPQTTGIIFIFAL